MRTTTFDPFWRSSVGFDRLFDLMNTSTQVSQALDQYPPYNIAKTGEDTFRISIAVAGFKPEQIAVTAHQNTLIVEGNADQSSSNVEYLFRGIPGTPFERRFNLADFIEVKSASFHDGILEIDLERRVPEAMKPRRIDVKTSGAQASIESRAA